MSELLSLFHESLDTLSKLAKVYDNGFSPIAFSMAVEVSKLFTENSEAMKLRSSRIFTSPRDYYDSSILNTVNKLIIAKMDDKSVTCLPYFFRPVSREYRKIQFKEWWNNDVIYRASAAPEGSIPGSIPISRSLEVPFEKRMRMNRRQLITLLRNKFGAHHANEIPRLLDEIGHVKYWQGFQIATEEEILSTHDGSLPVLVGPVPAMMRQIAHEVLVAYGRPDEPPSGTE